MNLKYFKIFEKEYFIFIAAFLITATIYWHTKESKFVSDFMQWVDRYDKMGWSGILNSFGDVSLKYVYHILMFLPYKLFGFNAFGWHLLMCLLQAVNALVIYRFLKLFWIKMDVKKFRFLLSVIPVALFILSPFNTETIVWSAAIHFLVIPTFVFQILTWCIHYVSKKRILIIVSSTLLFMIGLLATEAILILPIICFFLFILINYEKESVLVRLKGAISFILPQLSVIFLFFGATYWSFGNMAGHYGASTHFNIDIQYISLNFIRYHLKFFFFFRYWISNVPEIIQVNHNRIDGFLVTYWKHIVLAVLLIVVIKIFYIFYKRKKSFYTIGFFYVCFILALLPVINLENQSWFLLQTDRYSFLSSIFFYIFLSTGLILLLKHIGLPVLIIYLLLGTYFLMCSIKVWRQNGALFYKLIDNFPYKSHKKLYVLSLADNYKGAYLFRNGITEALQYRYKDTFNSELFNVAYMNMQKYDDSIKVKQLSQDSLYIIVSDWGRWFWHYGKGASDSLVNFNRNNSSHEYFIKFNKIDINTKIIYQSGDEWRTVELNNKN